MGSQRKARYDAGLWAFLNGVFLLVTTLRLAPLRRQCQAWPSHQFKSPSKDAHIFVMGLAFMEAGEGADGHPVFFISA